MEATLPPGDCRVRGLAKIAGEIILIYDLEQLLSREDAERIHQAKIAAAPTP